MFGLSFMMFALLLIWGVLTLLTLYMETPVAQALRPRLIALLGATLIIAAFFFQPWIKFSFLDYIVPTPEFIKRLAPTELVTILIQKIGIEWLSKLIHVFKMFTEFNGWQIELIPTLGLGTRLITVFPLLLAIAAVISLPVCATFRGSRLSKAFGLWLLVLGVINAVLLLFSLAELDALGIQGNFQWNLLVTILGAHIGNGPWFCLLGLLLLGLGGLIEIIDSPPGEKDNSER